jgi:hypothetical protein
VIAIQDKRKEGRKLKEKLLCPHCGSSKFNKIEIEAQIASCGDVRCCGCANAYWRNVLEQSLIPLEERAKRYCASCTAKKFVENFECDTENLISGIQSKSVYTVTLNRPNFHACGTSEEILGQFVCWDEARVFGDYCKSTCYVGVLSSSNAPLALSCCKNCGASSVNTSTSGLEKIKDVIVYEKYGGDTGPTTYLVVCGTCYTETKYYEKRLDAIDAWNNGETRDGKKRWNGENK